MQIRFWLPCIVCVSLLGCPSKEPNSPVVDVAEDASAPAIAEDAAATGSTKERVLYVNSKRVECEGEGPQQCLQTRTSAEQPWELHYAPIEGFTFEEGHSYTLRVEVSEQPNPPQGGSSLRYRLLEVVEKSP